MRHAATALHSLVLLACSYYITFPQALVAQTPSFTIYGQVRLPDGALAPRVVVHVTSQAGMDRQTFSDDMGRFELRELPRGRYFLTAENRADPNQFTDPVEADTGRSQSNRVLVNIFLRYKATVTPKEERGAAVVSVAEATQHVPKAAQKAFEQGVKYRSDHRLEKALESFTHSIEVFPSYFQALAERGHLRIALGQVPEAAVDFARALEYNDRYEPALRGSGLCKFQQGKFAEAIQDLERALTIDPSNPTTFLFLGVSNLALDNREAARLALQKALSLDAIGSARAHVHLANLFIREKRFQDAVTELQAYLAGVPDAPDADKLRALEAQLLQQLKKN